MKDEEYTEILKASMAHNISMCIAHVVTRYQFDRVSLFQVAAEDYEKGELLSDLSIYQGFIDLVDLILRESGVTRNRTPAEVAEWVAALGGQRMVSYLNGHHPVPNPN